MNQMQSVIEKAKNDKELMAKLDVLGASGAEADKYVALAAEYGFTITAEDYRKAAEMAGTPKTGELKEEDLEAAAGGATQNRWNPEVCGKYTRVEYECVGFLKMTWCDHYREEYLYRSSVGRLPERYRFTCAMGRYNYEGNPHGNPT